MPHFVLLGFIYNIKLISIKNRKNKNYRTYATLAIAILRKPIACPTDIYLSEAAVTECRKA